MAGVAAGAALAAGGFLAGRRTASEARSEFRALTFRRGIVFSARFSPDARKAYYGASWEGEPTRVFVAALDGPERRAVAVPPGDVFGVAPSGEFLVGLDRRFRWSWITKADLAMAGEGAPAKPLAGGVLAAGLSGDGTRVALARAESREILLEMPPGHVVHRKAAGWIGPLAVLAPERGVAFCDHPVWGDWRGTPVLLEPGGRVRRLVDGNFEVLSGLAARPGSDEVWFSASEAGLDSDVRAVDVVSGSVRSVLRAPGSLRLLDVARDGRALVSRDEHRPTSALRTAAGADVDLTLGRDSQVVAISDGGRLALLASFGEDGKAGGVTYLRGLDGKPPVLLGEGEACDLSPDGKWAVALRHGEIGALALLPTAGGEARTFLLPRAERNHWARFTPDGRALLVSANETGRKIRIYFLDLATGASRAITPEGVGYLLAIRSTGDAVTSVDLDGVYKVFPLDGSPPRAIPGVEPGEEVQRWLPGDREFLVCSRTDVPIRVHRVDAKTGARRLHLEVGPADRAGVRTVGPIVFDREGSTVAYNVSRLLSELFLVSGLR